jgi:peptide deformylase
MKLNKKPLRGADIVDLKDIPDCEFVEDVQDDCKSLVEAYDLCLKMERACIKADGIGLSAVQVGVPLKLFVVKSPDGEFDHLVNCSYAEVKDASESKRGIEGCLSLKNSDGTLKRYWVDRSNKILVTGSRLSINEQGGLFLEGFQDTLTDLHAVVYAHEIDHQNGTLISDIGEEISIW